MGEQDSVTVARKGSIMRKAAGYLCLISFLVLSGIVGFALERSIIIDDFEDGLKLQWRTEEFKGKTLYKVIKKDGGQVLRAESSDSASGLIYEFEYDPGEYPILTWRWRVENIIEKGDATKKEGDDYAARVYVIFPHWFPPMTKSVNYVWANRLPKGDHVPNAYYSKSIMIAVESGEEKVGRWIVERRNVYEDFKMLFGDEPPEVGGIAIMTDTDQTGESVTAYYDDVIIEKR
jgi:hypothetical protein